MNPDISHHYQKKPIYHFIVLQQYIFIYVNIQFIYIYIEREIYDHGMDLKAYQLLHSKYIIDLPTVRLITVCTGSSKATRINNRLGPDNAKKTMRK